MDDRLTQNPGGLGTDSGRHAKLEFQNSHLWLSLCRLGIIFNF